MTERPIPSADLHSLRDLSVDELFQQHLVRLIQQLYARYTSQVSQAKEDLHTLVGEKYRDLIRIAEDVDIMSTESSQVDASLSDLAYRPSRHAQFGACAASRFDSKIRMAKAERARELLQTTILNNVINNQIIGFDLKLKTNSISSTADLVHLAKIYHSVSSAFLSTLNTHPHISSRFKKLRAHFVQYLERKLACYSSNIPAGDLDISNLILKSSAAWSDMDALEDFEDSFGGEELEEASVWDHHGQALPGFLTQCVPILNLLVAYTIMTSDQIEVLSSDKLVSRFLSLRFEYFSEQLSSLLGHDSLQNVNFYAIFSFLEGTCLIVRKYLMGDGISDIRSRLSDIKAWNPADLLGFHNWMDVTQVMLAEDRFSALPDDYLNSAHSPLEQFSTFLSTFCSQLQQSVSAKQDAEPTHKLQLLHNLIASLRRVEIACAQMDIKSMAVSLSSETKLVSTFLTQTLQAVQQLIENQQNLLITQLVNFIKDAPVPSSNQEPFTLDFVSVIDNDVSEYLRTVIDVASQNDPLQSHATNDSLQCKLKQWFSHQRALLSLLEPQSEIRKGLQDMVAKKHRNLPEFELWQGFSFDTLQSQFDKVLEALKSSLVQKISEFKGSLSENFREKQGASDGEDILLELNILFIIRKNLFALHLSPKLAVEVELKQEAELLFEKLLNVVFTKGNFGSNFLFNSCAALSSTVDEIAISLGPHMRLYSMMNQLATNMFASSLLSESELYALYLDDEFKQQYVRVKNKWIVKNLINLIDFSQLTIQGTAERNGALDDEEKQELNSSDLEPETDADGTLKKNANALVSQTRQILANVAFILQFTSSDRISAEHEVLSVVLEKLRVSGANALDSSIVESVLRGVSNFYESGKETYMPLLLN